MDALAPLPRVAADRGLGHVDRGHRWGSAKAERGYQWSPRKKVGGTTLSGRS